MAEEFFALHLGKSRQVPGLADRDIRRCDGSRSLSGHNGHGRSYRSLDRDRE